MKQINNICKLALSGTKLLAAGIAMVIALSTVLMITAGDSPAITTYYSVVNDIAGFIVFAGMGWVVAKEKKHFKYIWKEMRTAGAVA